MEIIGFALGFLAPIILFGLVSFVDSWTHKDNRKKIIDNGKISTLPEYKQKEILDSLKRKSA